MEQRSSASLQKSSSEMLRVQEPAILAQHQREVGLFVQHEHLPMGYLQGPGKRAKLDHLREILPVFLRGSRLH